ncbi:uncharacterized protein PHA67_024402 [Liasis olivaceus]
MARARLGARARPPSLRERTGVLARGGGRPSQGPFSGLRRAAGTLRPASERPCSPARLRSRRRASRQLARLGGGGQPRQRPLRGRGSDGDAAAPAPPPRRRRVPGRRVFVCKAGRAAPLRPPAARGKRRGRVESGIRRSRPTSGSRARERARVKAPAFASRAGTPLRPHNAAGAACQRGRESEERNPPSGGRGARRRLHACRGRAGARASREEGHQRFSIFLMIIPRNKTELHPWQDLVWSQLRLQIPRCLTENLVFFFLHQSMAEKIRTRHRSPNSGGQEVSRGTDGHQRPWNQTVLWGEVVGCIVLGLDPACQITIQSTVFPEVAVIATQETSSHLSGNCALLLFVHDMYIE